MLKVIEMSCYINPVGETKGQFLNREGMRCEDFVELVEFRRECQDCLPVALIDNGMFNSALVCYNEEEVRYAMVKNPIWYLVERSKLLEVSDLNRFVS